MTKNGVIKKIVFSTGAIFMAVLLTVLLALYFIKSTERKSLARAELQKINAKIDDFGNELVSHRSLGLDEAYAETVDELKKRYKIKTIKSVQWKDRKNHSYDLIYPSRPLEHIAHHIMITLNEDRLFAESTSSLYLYVIFINAITLLVGLLVSFYRFLKSEILSPLSRLKSKIDTHGISKRFSKRHIFNINQIIDDIVHLIEKRIKYEREFAEVEHEKKLNLIAKNMAHDIRSPLTALNVLAKTSESLSDSERQLLATVSERVTDLANGLLKHSSHQKSGLASQPVSPGKPKAALSIVQAVEEVVEEKNMEFHDLPTLKIKYDRPDCVDVFSPCNETSFKRSLSNIINNAAEAMHLQGTIRVKITAINSSRLRISVSDNGVGMSENQVNQALNMSLDSNKHEGTGIGLKSAVQFCKEAHGELIIHSTKSLGTTVTLELPREKAPEQFVTNISRIDISKYDTVLSIDDDASFSRLLNEAFKNTNVNFISCNDMDSIENTIEAHVGHDRTLFMFDQNISPAPLKGVDYIYKYNLEDRSLLITSDSFKKLSTSYNGFNIKYFPKRFVSRLIG